MGIEGISGTSGAAYTEPLLDTRETPARTALTDEPDASPSITGEPVPDFQADYRRFQLNNLTLAQPAQPPENRVGALREGDRLPISIDADDTQPDVLRRAYTEYAKRAGLSNPDAFVATMVRDGNVIYHAGSGTPFTPAEFEAQRAAGSINMIPTANDMTALRQSRIQELLSRGLFDWAVTSDEQRQIVDLLRNDPNLSATVRGLSDKGLADDLINGVSDTDKRRELIDLLGRNLNADTTALVGPHVERLDVNEGLLASTVNQNLWQVRFNLARLGITPTTTPFDRSAFSDLISSDASAPFSGVGATGTNPINGSVPLADQAGLLFGNDATERRYSNPIPGSLPDYLASLSPQDRARQAQLLLNQPVSTTMPEIYGGQLPTRTDVIRAAAAKYNLEPELVAAFILAEQRDQSGREDAKDYTAATSVAQGNTSIGLGQVVISTAQRNRLFSDLISERTQGAMSHNDIARLLADDTANVFAVAKYLRQVADDGARRSIGDLPATRRKFPEINLPAYSNNSARWSADNVRALGSEYTSRAWDDNLSPGWGDFVYEAYRDVRSSGVFQPR